MHQSYRHLKPGFGHFEQVEIDLRPRCDDDSLPYEPIQQWYDYLADATTRANRSIVWEEQTRRLLEVQGFVDIEIECIKLYLIPHSGLDRHSKEVSRWYNVSLRESRGIEAMSLGPLTRVFKWSVADVNRLGAEVSAALRPRSGKVPKVYNRL